MCCGQAGLFILVFILIFVLFFLAFFVLIFRLRTIHLDCHPRDPVILDLGHMDVQIVDVNVKFRAIIGYAAVA